MSLIDPEQHAHLIELQRASNRAYAALYGHAPGVRGQDMTKEQVEEAKRLRQEAPDAAEAVHDALDASGLVAEHGYYQPSQDLKDLVREQDAGE